MTEEQQLKTLRYWVAQGSKAIQDIAFIEAFEAVRTTYLDGQTSTKSELPNPMLNPLGRVAIGRLASAEVALVLFCTKSLDQGSQTASIKKLKNSLIRGEDAPRLRTGELVKAFRDFERSISAGKINTLRDKLIAHADEDVVLGVLHLPGTTRELIEYAKAILHLIGVLIKCSELVPKGTVDNPILCDNSLVLHHPDFAFADARQFWEQNFEAWG